MAGRNRFRGCTQERRNYYGHPYWYEHVSIILVRRNKYSERYLSNTACTKIPAGVCIYSLIGVHEPDFLLLLTLPIELLVCSTTT